MTDLDDLKKLWMAQDHRLNEALRLNRQALTAITAQGARSAIHRMVWADSVQAAIWLAMAIFLGGAIAGHWAEWRLISAIVLVDLYIIFMLAATLRVVVTARAMDFSEPVTVLQARLGALQRLRIRVTQVGLLAGTAIWAPCLVVVLKLALGVDFDNPAWLIANVAFGLALIPLAYWIARNYADRMAKSPFWQRVMQEIAGRSMQQALEAAATLAGFTAE